MRTIPIAVAALALMNGVASAQTSTTPNAPARPAPGATTAPAPAQKIPAINPLTQEDISKIDGTAVYGGDDGKIGHVSTVLMDPASKKLDRLVVTSGGVPGGAGPPPPTPVGRVSWGATPGVFNLGLSRARPKQPPA